MRVRFFLDENIPGPVYLGVIRHSLEIDVLRVGDAGAPRRGTMDRDLLTFSDNSGRVLITNDRSTMPGHVEGHLQSGGHHWGVLRVRARTSIGDLIRAITLVWDASDAEEWIDFLGWIPFR